MGCCSYFYTSADGIVASMKRALEPAASGDSAQAGSIPASAEVL
jgi:hypothetical protein